MKEAYPKQFRRVGKIHQEHASPPVEEVTPEWIYELARISNTEAVLSAIALKPPKQIEFSNVMYDKKVVLLYDDDAMMGQDSYTWNYIGECEVYLIDWEEKCKKVYLLWRNTVDDNWYAAFTYSYAF